MGSLDWAECTGLITKKQVVGLATTREDKLPNGVMTISRGRLLEYLYHLAGSPEVKNLPEKSPYTDRLRAMRAIRLLSGRPGWA